jgi:hypothetical protein
MSDEEKLLSNLGLNFEMLDSGCCGLAGSFGFENDHYDISMKVGERRLLPAVRAAEKDALIVSDGFSCKTQIEHATDGHCTRRRSSEWRWIMAAVVLQVITPSAATQMWRRIAAISRLSKRVLRPQV